MFKYQKIGEMDSEYPFLFCSKSDFWMEIPNDKVNSFENTKRQTPKMTFVFVLKVGIDIPTLKCRQTILK